MLASEQAHQEFKELFFTGTKLEYKKGEAIIHPTDEPRGIYYIESGYVKAYSITKYGEENLLIIRKDNDIFPLIWAVTNEHRDITYQAMSDTVIWRIAKSTFLEHVKASQNFSNVLVDLAIDAYHLHSERVMNLEYRTVKERIAMFLLTHGERFGKKMKDGSVIVSAPIRRHDIASSVNASRETTSRELMSLSRAKLIEIDGSTIKIVQPEKLEGLL